MRDYTTIEQSERLVELGLNPDTADMYWYKFNKAKDTEWTVAVQYEPLYDGEIPCWSLGALMEVMPPYLFEFERGIDLNIYRNLNGRGWHASYMPNNIEDMQKDGFKQIVNGDTPIEAAYNMVVWLLENGYLQSHAG